MLRPLSKNIRKHHILIRELTTLLLIIQSKRQTLVKKEKKMEWETLGSEIANAINDLPIGLGSKVANLEHLDLLTPNRLKLGRNNNRSPVGLKQISYK